MRVLRIVAASDVRLEDRLVVSMANVLEGIAVTSTFDTGHERVQVSVDGGEVIWLDAAEQVAVLREVA